MVATQSQRPVLARVRCAIVAAEHSAITATERAKHGWHRHGQSGMPAVCTLHAVTPDAASAWPMLVPPVLGVCKTAIRQPWSFVTFGFRSHAWHRRGVDEHEERGGHWQSEASGKVITGSMAVCLPQCAAVRRALVSMFFRSVLASG